MKNKCDCFIGRLCSEEVRKSNIIGNITEATLTLPRLQKYGLYKDRKCLTPKEMADNRRGYLHRFIFCPYCGEKINWKEILKDI